MNKRIKELIALATEYRNNPLVDSEGKFVCDGWHRGVNLEKFAELIVEEFRNVATDYYRTVPLEYAGVLLTLDEKIAEHFYTDDEYERQ
jgi:hypothetical protein